ncbi:MAG: polymerase subunit beta [Pseudomonadota bacterium]|jgi:DNA polymerase-3 subunit beta
MQFTIANDVLLPRLQQAVSVVERRATIPILSNLFFSFRDGTLFITGSDTEVQVISELEMDVDEDADFTVPARKLIDLLKALPESCPIKFQVNDDRVVLTAASSRYALSTLPAEDYPAFELDEAACKVTLPASLLEQGLRKTFAFMGQQDVRYFLNGVMMEFAGNIFRCVSSDGHRMAVFEDSLGEASSSGVIRQFILPRKAVLELLRLLPDQDIQVRIEVAANTCSFVLPGLRFSTKLIEGRYPDFRRVLPATISHVVHIARSDIKSVLARIAILTSEKSRAVMLHIKDDCIHFEAHCMDNDSAHDTLSAEIAGPNIDLCFNVNYMLDVVGTMSSDTMRFSLAEQTHTALFEDVEDPRARYLVMPLLV